MGKVKAYDVPPFVDQNMADRRHSVAREMIGRRFGEGKEVRQT